MVRPRLIVALALLVFAPVALGADPARLVVTSWLDGGVDSPALPPPPKPSEPDDKGQPQPGPFRGDWIPAPPAPVALPRRWGLTDNAGQRWESIDRAALEAHVAAIDRELARQASYQARPYYQAARVCGPGGCR